MYATSERKLTLFTGGIANGEVVGVKPEGATDRDTKQSPSMQQNARAPGRRRWPGASRGWLRTGEGLQAWSGVQQAGGAPGDVPHEGGLRQVVVPQQAVQLCRRRPGCRVRGRSQRLRAALACQKQWKYYL